MGVVDDAHPVHLAVPCADRGLVRHRVPRISTDAFRGADILTTGPMIDAAPPPPLRPRRPSPAVAALLGWVVPGLGHAYVGRPGKGLFLAAVVLATYLLGLVLAEFRCVSWERYPFWFAGQAVAAGPTALVAWLTKDLAIDHRIPLLDVGLLYVSVASLLNAVVVADALGLVDEQCAAADAYDDENERIDAELRAGLAAAAAAEGSLAPVEVPSGTEAALPPPPDEPPPPSLPSPLLPRADLPGAP
jgi:hypothetical protein